MLKTPVFDENYDVDCEEKCKLIPKAFSSKFFNELNDFHSESTKESYKKNKETSTSEDSSEGTGYCRMQTHVYDEVIRNGNKIKGTWKNNQLHGLVIIEYHDGAYFEGTYQFGVRVQGVFKFSDGHQYQGEFEADQFSGHGILKYPNGKTIQGNWEEGELTGRATITYPNLDVYYGTVQNYKKHGEGCMFFKNGKKYIGEFANGEITGQGKYLDKEELLVEGQWKNGKFLKQSTSQKEIEDPEEVILK